MKPFTALLGALLLAVAPAAALAADPSSASYTITEGGASNGGGSGSSPSYGLNGAGNSDPSGASSSGTYQTQGGSNVGDNTAPLTGALYDGPVANSDIEYQIAMDRLDGSWFGFSDPESGIDRYEYLFRRDDGLCWSSAATAWRPACDGWVSTGTATQVSLQPGAPQLGLYTGAQYVICVRAVNSAALTSAEACSNGVMIQPSATFSFDTSTVMLPKLEAANNYDSSSATLLNVTTNAKEGYSIALSKTQPMRNVSDPSQVIPDVADSGCSGAAVPWPGASNFGITSSTDIDSNKFHIGQTRYCAVPTGGGLKIAERTAQVIGGTVSENSTVTYRSQTTAAAAAGTYLTTVKYAVIPRY